MVLIISLSFWMQCSCFGWTVLFVIIFAQCDLEIGINASEFNESSIHFCVCLIQHIHSDLLSLFSLVNLPCFLLNIFVIQKIKKNITWINAFKWQDKNLGWGYSNLNHCLCLGNCFLSSWIFHRLQEWLRFIPSLL